MKRLLALPFAIVGLLATTSLIAQTPSKARTEPEQRTLDRALDFYQNILGGLQIEKFKDYVAPHFIEHHPGVDGNRESLEKYFSERRKSNPNGLPVKILLSMVDGDLVTMLVVRGAEADPKDAAKGQIRLGVEVLRIKDGKQVEHWDEEMLATDPALQHLIKAKATDSTGRVVP
jgi:predicted SnoaL-like aldol condensation-catalyzing enzyme